MVIDCETVFDSRAELIMDNSHSSGTSWSWPEELGTGSIYRIKISPGIVLGIGEFQVFEDIELTVEPNPVPTVFHFSVPLQSEFGYRFMDNQNEFHFARPGLNGTIAYRPDWQGVFKLSRGIPVRSVVIYIDSLRLNPFMGGQYDRFPTELCDFANGNHELSFSRSFTLTPAVYEIISHVFDCPYSGALKRFYFEAKAIELITYAMAQMIVGKTGCVNPAALPPNDIKRVRNVKDILLSNLENPPSLIELARKSGTNKNKLNTDFRRVFGTSVFEFLRTSRLEHAKILLEGKEMNVTEVAFEVGYAHQQSFSRAFRNHFGTNPADCLR